VIQSTKIARLEKKKKCLSMQVLGEIYSEFSDYRTQTVLRIEELTKDLDDQKNIVSHLSYVIWGSPNIYIYSDSASGDGGSSISRSSISRSSISRSSISRSGDRGSGDIYHLNLDFQPENPYIVVENFMNDYWSIINNMRNLNNIVQNNENPDFHVASPSDLQFAFQESPTPQGEPSGQQRFIVREGVEIPNEFLCPITLEIMQDPVIASDGNTYERSAILQHINMHSEYPRSPLTRDLLQNNILIPNNNLVKMIEDFCMAQVVSRQE